MGAMLSGASFLLHCRNVHHRSESPLRLLEQSMPQSVVIKYAGIAIDVNDKLPITENGGKILGYYRKIVNPNGGAQGYSISDTSDKLVYKLMPADENGVTTIAIKDAEGTSGAISIATKRDLRISTEYITKTAQINLFAENLQYEDNYEWGSVFQGTSSYAETHQERIFLTNGELMVGLVEKTFRENPVPNYPIAMANRKFVSQKPILAVCLVLSLDLISKVESARAKQQKSNTVIIHDEPSGRTNRHY